MLTGLQVNNNITPKHDRFWDLENRQLKEMQEVDDRQYSHAKEDGKIITNTSVATCTPDLFKKCKEAVIDYEQFTNTCLN